MIDELQKVNMKICTEINEYLSRMFKKVEILRFSTVNPKAYTYMAEVFYEKIVNEYQDQKKMPYVVKIVDDRLKDYEYIYIYPVARNRMVFYKQYARKPFSADFFFRDRNITDDEILKKIYGKKV